MAMPYLSAEQVQQVSGLLSEYIAAQRRRFSPQAVSLSAVQRAAMSGFFLPEVLDRTRILVLRGYRVENPPFYPMLEAVGFSHLPDISQMATATFGDVVVSHVPFTDGLLFHELVHAEQYRQLGIPRFSELYVRGFLSGGGYESIPLEANAYELGRRFERDCRQEFSVAEEVARWVREGRF